MGVWGGSAGGHLALTLGTTADDGDPTAHDLVLQSGNRVAAVVAYYPIVDLRQLVDEQYRREHLPEFWWDAPSLAFDPADAPALSPLLHVTADTPPTLLVHGNQDEVVDLSHSRRMFEALQDRGVESKLVVIDGGGHGFRDTDAEPQATDEMVRWFSSHLVTGH